MATMIPFKNSAFTPWKSGNLKETLNFSRQVTEEFVGNHTRLCSNHTEKSTRDQKQLHISFVRRLCSNRTVSIHPISSSNPGSEIKVLSSKDEVIIKNNNLGQQRLILVEEEEEKVIEEEILTEKEELNRKRKGRVLSRIDGDNEVKNPKSKSQSQRESRIKKKKMKIKSKVGESSIVGEQPSRLNNGIKSDTSISSSTLVASSINQDRPSGSTNALEANQKELIFEKVLTPSDVGDLNRLLITRRFAELHFPSLVISKDTNENENASSQKKKEYKKERITFTDNENRLWVMKYEYVPKSSSFLLTTGWKAFVKHHRLRFEDIILIYKLGSQQSMEKHFGMEYYRHRVPLRTTLKLFGQEVSTVYMGTNERDLSSDRFRSNGGIKRHRKGRAKQSDN